MQLARHQPAQRGAALRDGLRIRARRPASCRAAAARFAKTTGVSAATKSLLGAALWRRRRYAEAEAVLLDARRELETSRPGAECGAQVHPLSPGS